MMIVLAENQEKRFVVGLHVVAVHLLLSNEQYQSPIKVALLDILVHSPTHKEFIPLKNNQN